MSTCTCNQARPKMRPANDDDVSKFIQQAKATADLLRQCMESEGLEVAGTAGPTLINSLWAIDDLLNLAQHAMNGGEVPNDQV
jgi:hypothetical protein